MLWSIPLVVKSILADQQVVKRAKHLMNAQIRDMGHGEEGVSISSTECETDRAECTSSRCGEDART